MRRDAPSVGDDLAEARTELIELERRLRVELGAGGPFLRREGLRLLDSGGKRLRPAMCIAAGHLGEYRRDRVLAVAGAIELIHTATLVHDDVIDAALLRRGAPTTHARHGAHTAVYVGDWLLVKALRTLSALEPVPAGASGQGRLPGLLVEGLESVCAGEVDQYLGRGRIPGIRTYLSRIEKKTAALFSAACAAGAMAAGLEEPVVRDCAAFGRAFGIAFQIRDDLLDVASSTETTGKPVAHDLQQGIVTLPYLLAVRRDASYRARLLECLRGGSDPAAVRGLTEEMIALGGLSAAQDMARESADEAAGFLAKLPASRGRSMLAVLSSLPEPEN